MSVPQEQRRPAPSIAAAAGAPSPASSSVRRSIDNLKNDPDQLYPFLAFIGLVFLLVLSYANSLEVTLRSWRTAEYSHGYLVPLFAVVLLWLRRQPFKAVPMRERWWGLLLLTAGLAARLVGAWFSSPTIDSPTLVICLLGVTMLVGGLHMIRWAGPAIGFLIFMYPLPRQYQAQILGKLQTVAIMLSTYIIETLGFVVVRTGNVITIQGMKVGVVEACSGLRMATIFVALAVAIVLVTKRPWWDRLIILLSSIPIALAVNAIRITVTCLLFMAAGEVEWVKKFSHDGAGYFMMPLALGFLYLELQILDRLVIEEDSAKKIASPVRGQRRRAPIVP